MSSNDKAQSKIGSMAQAAMSEGDKSTADRRRSSTGQYSTITHTKRGSLDEAGQLRKQSLSEQTKPAGFLGGLWNQFTKGQK